MNAPTQEAVLTKERPRQLVTAPTAELPAQPPSPGTLLNAIAQAAANPQVDIEKMERLFAMHQQMVKQDAEAAFNAAMARAQANIVPIATNAENSHTHSRYAKLEAINREIVPLYTAEGLSISFDTADAPITGWMRTIAHVSHAAGHTRTYHLDLPPDAEGAKGNTNKTGVQAAGSTSSYARRYLTCMIFNVTTFDDNDGNGTRTSGAGKTTKEKKSADYPEEAFKKNLPQWTELIQSGQTTAERIINKVSTKAQLTEEQKAQIKAIKAEGNASPALIANIRAKAAEAQITEQEILKRFKIGALDNLPAALYLPVLAFIADPVANMGEQGQ